MCSRLSFLFSLFFFFNDTATTEIYTLSLHDALPICVVHSFAFEITEQSGAVSVAQTASDDRLSCETSTDRSEEHTSELQSHSDLVCRLLLEKKKKKKTKKNRNTRLIHRPHTTTTLHT